MGVESQPNCRNRQFRFFYAATFSFCANFAQYSSGLYVASDVSGDIVSDITWLKGL